MRGRSAGLRTQAIVGTSAALIVLVSKYGFGDVLASGRTTAVRLRVHYLDGQGILRRILSASTSGGWAVSDLTSGDAADREPEGRSVEVAVGLSGSGNSGDLLAQITDIPGVLGVEFISDEEIE